MRVEQGGMLAFSSPKCHLACWVKRYRMIAFHLPEMACSSWVAGHFFAVVDVQAGI